mgnify:CR=1 FL=1
MKNTILILLAALFGIANISYSAEYEDLKVFFEFDSYTVTPATQETVNNRKSDFIDTEIVGFEIYGYCDDLGSTQYNKYLSRKRANAIKQLLIDLGISRKTIKRIKGKGEIKLIDSYPIEVQRQKNRRVEIKILYKSNNNTQSQRIETVSSDATQLKNVKSDRKTEDAQPFFDEIRPSIINNVLKPIEKIEKSTALKEEKTNTPIVTVETNTTIPKNEEVAPKNEDDELDILTVMTKGERLTLEEILFVSGTAKLIKSSEVEIKKLAKTLKKNENIKIQILGHVCCAKFGLDGVDDETGERNLSVVRAKAVYDELKNLGVQPGQMIYEGRKSKEPLGGPVENDRRVEILIIDL